MLILASAFFLIVAVLLAVPVGVLALEVVAATFLPASVYPESAEKRSRIAVLVPAHNEGVGIAPTLADIVSQLRPGDRLLVVADNCSDDTAAVATASGAELVQRNDLNKIGKGYALDWGIKHLAGDPPAIVVMIDADCRIGDGSIDNLATVCALVGRPVQALNLMMAPAYSPIRYQVAEFAWRLKNWIRPLGLKNMNMPCQLTGTGMAFPWKLISSSNLASGSIVEDLKLGLDVALLGSPAIFCPTAIVTSRFPLSTVGAAQQRQRWEQGHITTILNLAPHLLYTAIKRCNMHLFVLTLDLIIPPIVLLASLLIATNVGTAMVVGISSWAFLISEVSFILFSAAMVLSWSKFGRDVLPARAFMSVGAYALDKLKLYSFMASGRSVSHWKRADRSGAGAGEQKHDNPGKSE